MNIKLPVKKPQGLFIKKKVKGAAAVLLPPKRWRVTLTTRIMASSESVVRRICKELYGLQEIVKLEVENATGNVQQTYAQTRGHESAKQWLRERGIAVEGEEVRSPERGSERKAARAAEFPDQEE